jgi:hypothetical protein
MSNKKPKIILISGKAESGKDTVASFICNEILEQDKIKSAVIVHYADYLKYICQKYYEWDGSKSTFGRSLLQNVGAIARKEDPLFWVQTVSRLVSTIFFKEDFIIIPDARFFNEIAHWITLDYEVITIRVERSGHENILTEKQRQHSSEVELDNYDFDVYIENTDLCSLRENCQKFVEDILC